MSPAIISIIMWIPFVVVFVVAAIVFCISGYKRGIWRALISLGITVVSALISILFAKLIASLLAGGIVDSILASLPVGDAVLGMVKPLLPSMVQAMLAIVLFAGLFFILTFALKIVGNVVKKDALQVETKELKWGGLGVRMVDAFIYTLLLLLPLYGTIGAYMPTVQTVFKMSGDEEILSYLSAISDHPIVGMTSHSPIGVVYNQLSDAKTGESSVNIAEVVGVMDETMVKFEALSTASEEEFDEACLELVTHLKENVVEADWSYALISETTDILKNEIVISMEDSNPEEIETVENVIGMLDMSKEEFQENGVVMLDFVEYAIRNDVMASLETGDLTPLKNDEFYQEAATLLNATKQTAEIKKYLITETVTEVFAEDATVAKQIMDAYDDSAITTAEAQQQEIEALIAVSTATTPEELKEALLEVPTLDDELLNNAFNNLGAN